MFAVVLVMSLASAGAIQTEQLVSAADSQRITSATRRAQERFERTRRDHLSWVDGGWSDHCDEVVSFHCFTYGDPEDVWVPDEEDEEVTAARDSLLNRLRSAVQQVPGDRWLVGELVRYLVEAGKPSEGRLVGTECRVRESWWCHALVGYAAHAGGDFYAAEVAFDQALDTMDPGRRCEWTDISLLIPTAPDEFYRDLSCEARATLNRRFWWIADPLYLTPGNERRSEHFSRHVYVQFESGSPSIASRSPTKAFNPWVIRYGSPAGWERQRSSSMSSSLEPQIITHYRGPTHVFEPGWRALDVLQSLTPEALPLRPEAARTGYVPTYARRFDTLRYQLAVFRVPDSAVVLGAYELSSDSVPSSATVLAGLFLRSEDDTLLGTQSLQSASGILTLRVPERPGLVSLEAKADDQKRAGRARFWLPLSPLRSDEIAISDVLLLSSSESDSLPRDLESAGLLALKGTTVAQGNTVGLYWEVYGLPPGAAPVSMSLTLVKEGKNLFRSVARSLKLAGPERAAVRLGWTDVSPVFGPMRGRIAINVGKNDPGRYTLRIGATSQGRGAAAQREIFIVKTQ